MMNTFRFMVNSCIKMGLEHNVSTIQAISKLCYSQLSKYHIVSYYKINTISKAAGILVNRKQSIKRGYQTKIPYLKKAILISSYGFKIEDGILKVPLGSRRYFSIPLNSYVKEILSDSSLHIRSFTLTSSNGGANVSICYSKEVGEIPYVKIKGVDRNLNNITIGDAISITQYDLSKTIRIAETTRDIMSSLKRNDVRLRKKLYRKYGQRGKNRINQLLHKVSKTVVVNAADNKSGIAFERLTYIKRLYQRGNGQGRVYRYKLNGWSFAEIKKQIEYKAVWIGVPVIQLSTKDTRGTSQQCPRCGKRVQGAHYKDVLHRRQLWCPECKSWMDRDVVAAMNIAKKGGEAFHRSKGVACEAMKGNPTTTAILRVDATKLSFQRKRKAWQNPE